VFEDLVKVSDAVFSNLRGHQPAKLALRYQDLEGVNPRIVCCSLSGFGMSGPRRTEGAYDYTVQGLAGWQSVTGGPEEPPIKSGLSLADFCGGYVAAIAILAGVWSARRDGRGTDIDLSLFETALAQLTYIGTWVASRGYVPERKRNSAHQTMVPFQNFETADGWLVVACPKQPLWERLCRVIGQPQLLEDERYRTFALRDQNREELLGKVEAIFRSRGTVEWLQELSSAGIPCAPVNTVAEALADGHVAARKALVEVDHPVLGTVRQVASPIRLDGFTPPASRAPFRGEDTTAVLRDICGYSETTLAQLASDGVFGDLSLENEAVG
jgi:crotonobetainyl-CoA:carnitine CoA-transferase CaiB-like acyl-CoA transferase